MDVEAVKQRGAKMGLKPARTSTTLVSKVTKAWRHVPARLVQSGDILKDHGVVNEKFTLNVGTQEVPVAWMMSTGYPESTTFEFDPDAIVYAFTEVDMRYALFGTGKTVHILTISATRDTYGESLCGKSGDATLVPDSEVTKVCKTCTAVAAGEGE